MFVITLIVFVMFFLLPADSSNAQRNEQGFAPTLQTQFNFRGSFGEQYGQFVRRVFLHGDLGDSLRSDDAVTDVIWRTLPVTLSLLLGGMALWLMIAIPVGVLSALYPRSLLDRGLMLFVLAGASAHSVFLGLVFSYVFGVRLHWFPVGGYCDLHYQPDAGSLCGGPRYWAYHMENPHVDVIGHLTGRKITRREPMEIDLERVIEKALETGTFLEINSQPDRLDLRDVNARMAGEAGVPIVISSDAHQLKALDYVDFGVAQARRAWLGPEQIVNTRTWAQVRKLMKK